MSETLTYIIHTKGSFDSSDPQTGSVNDEVAFDYKGTGTITVYVYDTNDKLSTDLFGQSSVDNQQTWPVKDTAAGNQYQLTTCNNGLTCMEADSLEQGATRVNGQIIVRSKTP